MTSKLSCNFSVCYEYVSVHNTHLSISYLYFQWKKTKRQVTIIKYLQCVRMEQQCHLGHSTSLL